MNIYDILFLMCFFVCTGIILFKFYNTLNLGKIYNLNITWILFSGFLLSWLICFTVFLLQPERLIYSHMFNILSLLNYLNFLFLAAEIFLYFRVFTDNGVKSYHSINNK